MADRTDPVSFPIALQHEHRLVFTRDVFGAGNDTLAQVLTPREPGENVRALVFWDAGLEAGFPRFGEKIAGWFASRTDHVRLAATPVAVPGGEAVKNDFRQLEGVWSAINAAGLCRHSYVIAVGGGAVLDMVGFGAATAHRGIPLVRLPTTSLSQGDGGVGVKNGINFFGKKNWLGAFNVPHAIVNDLAFLHALPPRDRRAGLIEAVKVALIRDAAFFEFIAERVDALAVFAPEPYEAVIRASARQHMEHIATAGDPFERGSARPLDFGHWAAHKLEQLSEFRVSHGEAVAVGMAIDLIYSRRVGLLPEPIAERILDVIQRLGFQLFEPIKQIRGPSGRQDMLDGLEEFREHLGGRLTIPMIRAPGVRLDIHEMDGPIVKAAFDELRARYA
ncbi:3-dehydroquinate synthase [Horticoccus sp. 23ND18S-11]|uniref:3-dehydroquinate synthase n=1 Tax=Horticoccus sp. 23ND18S-11 TaxID=3391832 RepID=UPI0039C903D4